MAKFLNTTAVTYQLEELIKRASERLVLISPYLRFNDRIRELLEDRDRMKIDVRVVYGKSEMAPDEMKWLQGLEFIRTSFCQNLHAKCYLSESAAIVTSMNLYEFSQQNNNEMGVLVERDTDTELYRDTDEEVKRLVRISQPVKLSAESVPETATASKDQAGQQEKLSSSKVAKEAGLKTGEFIGRLVDQGYLVRDGEEVTLTEKGIALGGEQRASKRFGAYLVWPRSVAALVK